jgi:hypothetical protein
MPPLASRHLLPSICNPKLQERCVMSKNFLAYETIEDKMQSGDYRVEAIDSDGDGEVYIAIFVGPDAKMRAEEYADWKNSSQRPALSRAS